MVSRLGFTLGVALFAGRAVELPAQEATQLPRGVTAADTAAGDSLFHTLGGCYSCHGAGGVGADTGPGFQEGRWKLGDGSYEWLVHITRHGGYGIRNRGDEPMPIACEPPHDHAGVEQVANAQHQVDAVGDRID